ncbi:amino acid permease [Asanoa siamensis]|uniref:Amino acid permease n=2 Tax=Asanoa siamensis TaxID=926357 RepID=A0ABQ4CS84_9ACTN|nr:amino acid permease [Asanoa siamensis]
MAGIVTTFATAGVVGVPLSYLLLTAGLGLLTTGYVAMARRVGHAAPFFGLLAHGLGRAWGVAGGLLAVVGYNAVQLALYGFLGATLAAEFGGAWWIWGAVVCAAIGVLGVLRVDIGASVLATFLVAEFGVIVLFIVAAFTHPADGVVSAAPFLPSQLFTGDVGAVFVLGIAGFLGYESGQAYSEEARSDRAVGRATFAALLVLGPVYALSAWAMIVATGPGRIQEAAQADPGLPFTVLAEAFGVFGALVAALGKVLLFTSVFAAMLSFHATVARYLFGLARDGLLPAVLARTGTGKKSRRDAPVAASLVQSILAALVVGVFAVAGADPITTVFSWLAALAGFVVLVLLVAASWAAVVWFRRGGGGNESLWTRRIAPLAGIVAGIAVLAMMTVRMETLLGTDGSLATTLAIPLIVAGFVLAALCWAALVRAFRPKVWEGIGRGRPHPLVMPDQRLSEVRL